MAQEGLKKVNSDCPAFIADAMLGRLARWLRILGYDTLYNKDITDSELIRIARQEDRIILTRDRGITGKKTIRGYILITSDYIADQLREVFQALSMRGIPRPEPFTRCPVCNSQLQRLTKKEVSGLVPDHVYLNHSEFSGCPSCGRIYWRGSHEANMRGVLGEIA
ncbi:MAG: Mut7-C RNAse domain-containing protein [Thermodesulfovibrionales bacterium]